MDTLVVGLDWVPILVGAIVAFGVGAVWYSDVLFGKRWRAGIGAPVVVRPMMMPMLAQAAATFLLAWLIGIAETMNSFHLAFLIAFTAATLVKAQGLFNGKSAYAIIIDTTYVMVMAVVMMGVHILF